MVHIFRRHDADEGTTILSMSGDLDMAALPPVQSAIDRALLDGAAALIVDLGEVDSIDSSGLALLLGLGRQCEKASVRCVLSIGNEQVRRFVVDNGSDALVPVHDSLDDARRALRVDVR